MTPERTDEDMTYYTFMMRNYIHDDGVRGKLARDMHKDKARFPRNGTGKYNGWRKLIREYLDDHNASYQVMAAFEETWEEYELCERKRSNIGLRRIQELEAALR